MKTLNLDDIRHGVRVAGLCNTLGQLLDLEQKDLDNLYLACLFHDIGKAHIDQNILNKKGLLNPSEKEHLKEHPVYSCKEMQSLGYPKGVTDIILYHHENFDGSGYPKGLKGNSIPIGSRILKIVDVFDALTVDRPYRKKLSTKEAVRIINQEKNRYDPDVYKMFLSFLTIQSQNLRISSGGIRINQEEMKKVVSMVEWSYSHDVSLVDLTDHHSVRQLAKSSSSIETVLGLFCKYNHG